MNKKILIFILILAAFLRFFKLGDYPPSLNWDEISIGYTVNSILETGKDEWGEPPGLAFRSFGDYKPPLYFYLDLIFVKTLGLNPLSVRLPSAIFSTLLVLTVYYLVRTLFNNEKLALISSFVLAVSPWAIHMGRPAFESSLMCFVFTLGTLFFIKGLKKEKYFLLSALFFGLSLVAYHSSRVILPPFLFGLFLIYKKSLLPITKIKVISSVIFLIFFIAVLPMLFSVKGQSRFSQVSITADTGAITRNYENRFQSFLPAPIAKLVYNRPVLFFSDFLKNLLGYFSNEFLFIRGGVWGTHTIYNIPTFGVLFLFEAPFFFFGLYFLFKKNNSASKLILLWLFTAPFAAALTQQGGHPLRASTLTPVLQIIVALGILSAFKWPWHKLTKALLIICYNFFPFLFLVYYFSVYPREYAEVWQYQYKEAIDYVKTVEDKYDNIIITKHYGEPQIFLAYYKNIPPKDYQANREEFLRYEKEDRPWLDQIEKYKFQKYIFQYIEKEDLKSHKNTLFVAQMNEIPEGTYLLKKIVLPNDKTIIKITDTRLIEQSIKDGKIWL